MKVILLTFSLTILLLWAPPAWANIEQINDYQVKIQVFENSDLHVTETIDYDFGENLKHGIYRDIPITDKNWREEPFKIYDIKVSDENGLSYEFKISRSGSNINIKIGSEDRLVKGPKTYVIDYKVAGAFSFTEKTDNMFWNAIGTDWEVPILKNSVSVFLPKAIDNSQVQADCFFGGVFSTRKCSKEAVLEDKKKIDKIIFPSPQLEFRQGVTINVYFNKGLINQPPPPNIILAWLKRYGVTLLPVITFFVMFYLWYHKGRDPKGRGNVITQYDPPKDMMPAEVGVVYDEKVHSKDISAEIIYLAIKGYLKIKRIKKEGIFGKEDYVLEQLKNPDDLPRQYQKDLMNQLFGIVLIKPGHEPHDLEQNNHREVKLSSLKKMAYVWMKKIEGDIYDSVTKRGHFVSNPQHIRSGYIVGLFIILWLAQFLLKKFINFLGQDNIFLAPLALSLLLCAVVVFLFGIKMPKKTAQGALIKEHILGLKEYIDVAEKERIKFHNEPAKDPQVFEKLLPYAMALGLEKQWAKQFEGIYTQEPSWYAAGQGASFSAISFGNSLSNFRTTTASLTSSSTSGGGGVGGGGGGGGGGSW